MTTDPHGEREAARIVALALRQDASAQEAGDFEAIAERYDDVYAEVLVLCNEVPDSLARGFTFWDEWCDARNHEWSYYSDIARDDWPRLARQVAEAVESGAPITDPVLVRHLEEAAEPGLLGKLLDWLGRRKRGLT